MRRTAALAAAALAAGLAAPAWTDEAYKAEVRRWREDRETRLKADGGWLTLAGLFWLKEGPNRFGTDPSADIVLPPGTAPAFAGVFELKDGGTKVRVETGATVTSSGRAVIEMDLQDDETGDPTLLAVRMGRAQAHHILPETGWVSFYLHQPGDIERAIALLAESYKIAKIQKIPFLAVENNPKGDQE